MTMIATKCSRRDYSFKETFLIRKLLKTELIKKNVVKQNLGKIYSFIMLATFLTNGTTTKVY